ncbi:hypothetical protein [Citrobacter sp. R56]|uniref:hypothetical protein n=1 Tax=Citrobacter sp. R56 TaxID=1573676 RepID=UPI00107B6EF8|nr:hypothetical protein [Citrobacter sp. R56]QRG80035.1 hypothetical protein JM656_04735 [Citrobacter sp. R56]
MKLKTKVFYFWGGMDALAILIYCVHVLWQGGIPLISDILSFSRISDTGTVTGNGIYNTIVTLLFALDVILFVSLFISAWLFFTQNRYAVRFAFIQEVLRFTSLRCSISVFPLMAGLSEPASMFFNIFLFATSEVVKIYSLIYVIKSNK